MKNFIKFKDLKLQRKQMRSITGGAIINLIREGINPVARYGIIPATTAIILYGLMPSDMKINR